MPNMNRIRVNNVKYNFGTQQYDDFVMRMYGKNTIYDLANGGGKSVLMLLLLQNLIPNCTLDEKQPVEKLFRTSGGSTTIHSLIEWNLDEADIQDGYRFMLTGFCARKARDNGEEEQKDTAAIDYFNYCIFYRAYNANDLVNLPLVQNGERITYQELREYLKELEHTVADLKVYLFDRKGEYQHFISQYGLYESAWEMIRGINRTEGHVRTYFETNYKTTRKVVEDLLIEEIIEKSFRNKTQQEDMNEAMARTLLDMKDKLLELSEKKGEMTKFQHQKELLVLLSRRMEALGGMYVEKQQLVTELVSAAKMLAQRVQDKEQQLKEEKQQLETKKQECLEKNHIIACLKVQQEEEALAQQQKKEKEAQEQVAQQQEKQQVLQKQYAYRQSVNDYLEYQQMKAQRDAQQAIVEKARQGTGADVEKLYEYTAVKKAFFQNRREQLLEKIQQTQQEEKSYNIQLKAMMQAKRELTCDHAVTQAEKRKLEMQLKEMEAALMTRKQNANVLLLEEIPEAAQKQQQQIKQLEQEIAQLSGREEPLRQQLLALKVQEREQQVRQEAREEQLHKIAVFAQMLREGQDRINVLWQSYQMEKEFSREDLPQYETELDSLKKVAATQMLLTCQNLAQSKAQERNAQDILKAYENGQFLTDPEYMKEVIDYLNSRHEVEAVAMTQYLKELPQQEQQKMIQRWPFAPYGLLLKKVDEETWYHMHQDEQLKVLVKERIVPVFTKEALLHGQWRTQEGCLFLQGESERYLKKEEQEKRMQMQQADYRKIRQETERIQQLYQSQQEDFAYILEQISLCQIVRHMQEQAGQNVTAKTEDIRVAAVQQELVTLQETIAQKQKQKKEMQQRAEILTTCAEQYAQYKEQQKQLPEYAVRQEQEEQRLAESEEQLTEKNQLLKETRERLRSYRIRLKEEEKKWITCYEAYDKAYPVKENGLTEEEVEAQFLAMKAVVEKNLGSLEDKQALIDTLQENMKKRLLMIQQRHTEVSQLQQQYEEQELYEISEEELKQLADKLEQSRCVLDEKLAHLGAVQKQMSKCEGRIENGMRQLRDQGIHYAPLEIAKDQLERALQEQQQAFAQCVQEQKEQTSRYEEEQKQYAQQLDFYKDVKRLVELYHLQESDAGVTIDLSEYSLEQLKDCQKKFEKAMTRERKARQELEEYKQHTAQTLTQLHAYELAEVIRKDVVMPKNTAQLQDLVNSLHDMAGYIDLEQKRVEEGISDMQLIKSNFESQCIRRCQDVKTELERLPKLSGITLDGENIQMISLHIPYVPEEQLAEKMAEYIDHIVKGVDRYETVADRMKYIRSQLSLKRLFSVLVTDMNAIRLNLYKRERVKEQSRYLRYEEAVGSTGQSQGIYIQFLIAIINYIANIHSVNSDNNKLGKVIFIDNPFGAAKDIYIWEPIFEMLKTNNVQLIVPARGVTPAITGRFDVNYILGQKMVQGRQQTVVVDYRSQIEKTEMEYKTIEFTQNSFDFI